MSFTSVLLTILALTFSFAGLIITGTRILKKEIKEELREELKNAR